MYSFLRNKPLMFGLIATTLATGGSIYAYENYKLSYPRSLNAALDYYGFGTNAQKQALRYLMKQAGVNNVDALLDTRAVNQAQLIKSILTFVRETQEKFTIRTGTQERWEVQTPVGIKEPAQQKQILSALLILNMMDAVPPAFKKRDAICILGATNSVMAARLDYAGVLFAEGKLPAHWLIMLAGERYVTPDKNGNSIDGSEAELSKLATQIGKKVAALTETDLMKSAYENSKLYQKFPENYVVIIDTPRRNLPRPTTETTVIELFDWLK